MYNIFNDNFGFDPIDDFNKLATLGFFTKPLSVRFNTPNTKDIYPVAPWTKGENNYSTVIRVVGINEDDVEIELQEHGITVKGESETFGEKYTQEVSLGIAKDIMSNIEKVEYEVKNGMCKIIFWMKEPECRKISVTKVIGMDDRHTCDGMDEKCSCEGMDENPECEDCDNEG